MKASQLPLFTSKEDPRDAQVVSHRLLVRAGFIRKQAAGMYILLPFAHMVHQKIEGIIRNEMDKAAAIEVKLPVVTPAELWQQSGRWSRMGEEMMRFSDRHQHEFALGPTHEESMVFLVSTFLQSYKQLPLNLYQIGNKYRDEIRPRYGLIRCREFTMHDAYSFHSDETSLEEGYQAMRTAYRNIFSRSGLQTIAVDADSGSIGGSVSEEFMVASDIGEETLLLAKHDTDNIKEEFFYKANQEKTEFVPAVAFPRQNSEKPCQEVETVGKKTIEDVCSYLNIDAAFSIKTVILENNEHLVFVFIPGNRDLNEAKLKALSGLPDLEMAADNRIEEAVQAPVGYIGPASLPLQNMQEFRFADNSVKKVLLYFDKHLQGRGNLLAGANRKDYHICYLQEGRDFTAQPAADLILAQAGDLCPLDKKTPLTATKGIEVGHIFKLGNKYSKKMQLTFLGENGKPCVPLMGTYGIGVGRVLSTVVEQNHDAQGIIWPPSLTPFLVYFIGLGKSEQEKAQTENLYQALIKEGITVYYDDRGERAGVKFNDADLVGFPWQIVVGKTFFREEKLELKNRKSGKKQTLTLAECLLVLAEYTKEI